eukprot:CAMPEP_0118640342 /NCGR_PEP_ID=MMETSP0785-20121206/4703_1 /TAXON_ID=91992 /ORGANISM="Bolidomonas pacifica, Strain CCMP 1866" /LENGTH=1277 /DNA_ID=CAMNT_0006531725 /DNA_START=175 /DNA_END=4005 /DNA_ORIENTATION=-
MAALKSTLGTISLLQDSSTMMSDLGTSTNTELINILNEIDGKLVGMKLKYAKQRASEISLQNKLQEAHNQPKRRGSINNNPRSRSGSVTDSDSGRMPRRRMSITEDDVRNGLADRVHRVSIGVRRPSVHSISPKPSSSNQYLHEQQDRRPSRRTSTPGGNYGGNVAPKRASPGNNYGGNTVPKRANNPLSNYGGGGSSNSAATEPAKDPQAPASTSPIPSPSQVPSSVQGPPVSPKFKFPPSLVLSPSSSPGAKIAPSFGNKKTSPGTFSMAGPPRLEEVDTPVNTPKAKGGKRFAYSSLTPTNKSSKSTKKGFGMSGPPSTSMSPKAKQLEASPGNKNPETGSDTTEESEGTAGTAGTATGRGNESQPVQQSQPQPQAQPQPQPQNNGDAMASPTPQLKPLEVEDSVSPKSGRTKRRTPTFLSRSPLSSSPTMFGRKLNSPFGGKRNVNNELNAQKSLTLQHSTSNQRFERELHSQLPANAAIGVALFSKDSKEKVREAQVEKEQMLIDERETMAREAFEIIDVDHDGFLTKFEVLAALKKMNKEGVSLIPATMEAVEKMMKEVDEDGDGQIDKEEFAKMMVKTHSVLGKSGSRMTKTAIGGRMSVLARNVLLAHERVREKDNTIGYDQYLIHPHDWKHAFWDVVVSLLIMITVVTMPLGLGWECINVSLYELNLIVDTLFMCDVVKNFNTGYVDENESIVMDRYLVTRNYLFGYFIIDIVSSFPIDPILDMYGAGDDSVKCEAGYVFNATLAENEAASAASEIAKATKGLKMLKLLRMAKLFRLLRLSRVFRYIKMGVVYLEEKAHLRVSDGFTKLIKLAIGVLLICHWIGSFNFMICRLHDFPEDSWVVNSDLVGEPPSVQWTWSFFKALAMMIMIGFETPPFTNVNCDQRSDWCGIENWITLGCLYIGAVFYSLLISSVASILNSANMSSRIFEEKLGKLDDYMRCQKLPASLREKVKDHFHMQHSDGKLFDEQEILSSVTPILRREIVAYKNREILFKVPLLQDTEENKVFAHEVCTHLTSEIVFMDEIVLREDTTGNSMFFIFSGVIEIFLNSAADLTYVAVGDGCYFGEVSIILNCKRTASARTKTQCLLYRLHADDLKKLLFDFGAQHNYMKKIARARQKRIVSYLGLEEEEIEEDEEQDEEDAKTDLFGTDADEMMIKKDQEFEAYRAHARISVRATHNRPSQRERGSEREGRRTGSMGESLEAFRARQDVKKMSRARMYIETENDKLLRRNDDQSGAFEEEESGMGSSGGGIDIDDVVARAASAKGK